MSLFKSKEWWSVMLSENELYDSQCMLVSVIGKDRYQSIILGNHEGLFRIYSPSSGLTEDGNVIGYRPSDLLIEKQLPLPILQMGLGTLVSGARDKNLAILHPKLLTVYAVNKKETENVISDQIMLDVVYQHQLRHSAFSFVVGPFGGSRSRDFICVQSLDGLLSFYEQESFAFQVYLPDFLLPSPFVYLEKTDSFIFLNCFLMIECYSYENLASSSSSSSSWTESGKQRKISSRWSYNLGEGILDVACVATDVCNIVVLSERNLWNIGDGGKTIFTKRLEFRPMALHAFAASESKKLIILIATDDYLLNVYEDTCLKWSTRIDQIPVAVNRIMLSNLYGGIVLLSENGFVQCMYLGTHPSVYLLPTINQPQTSIAEMEEELRRLQKEISEKDVADPPEVDLIAVELSVDSRPVEEGKLKACKVSAELSNQTPVNKIQVLFVVDPPLSVTPKSCTVSCCDKTVVESFARLDRPGAVVSLDVKVYVSYLNGNGTPFVVARNGKLPLSLVLCRANPTKEAKHKITVVTNKPVCPLNTLFREFSEEESNPNAIGLRRTNSDAAVTILTAKTTQRYRLQSDCMESIGLVLAALVERLKSQFRGSSDFALSYDGALPLHTYFEAVERYHNLLQHRKSAREKLSKRACQYRTIQKKVLAGLRDVTPKPVSNLNDILKDTYDMIFASVSDIETADGELELIRYSIGALGRMLVTLMELMTIAIQDLKYLRVIFTGDVYEADDQGWLEAQQAAASFFLRTTLAKSVRDQQRPTDITLDPISCVSKLVKSLTSVIDRVTKGTHLLERSEFENDKEFIETIPGVRETPGVTECSIIPEGAKLANLDVPVTETASPPQNKKEKRLTKQERVDSFGIVYPTNADDRAIAEEVAEEAAAETAAANETENVDRKSSFDSPEDDAIWDVEVEEMRI